MIDLKNLLDEDIYQTYLTELQGKEFTLVCKHYPVHNTKNPSMSKDLLVRTKRYLANSLKLDKNFSKIDQLELKSNIPKKENDLTIFEFTFKSTIDKVEIDEAAASRLEGVNLEELKISSFCKEFINQYAFFHGKLDAGNIIEVIQKAMVQEKKNAVTLDRFLEFIEEYNLYYDYETKEFTYSLK